MGRILGTRVHNSATLPSGIHRQGPKQAPDVCRLPTLLWIQILNRATRISALTCGFTSRPCTHPDGNLHRQRWSAQVHPNSPSNRRWSAWRKPQSMYIPSTWRLLTGIDSGLRQLVIVPAMAPLCRKRADCFGTWTLGQAPGKTQTYAHTT